MKDQDEKRVLRERMGGEGNGERGALAERQGLVMGTWQGWRRDSRPALEASASERRAKKATGVESEGLDQARGKTRGYRVCGWSGQRLSGCRG